MKKHKLPRPKDAQHICDKFNCDGIILFYSKQGKVSFVIGGKDDRTKHEGVEMGNAFLNMLKSVGNKHQE